MAKDFTTGLTGTNFETALQAMQNAAANTAGDKKALVIFYLNGGMDCHNFISPANTASNNRTNYVNARPLMVVPVDNTRQTRLPGSTEWQIHPRFFGMHHSSHATQPSIVTSAGGSYNDTEIAVATNYTRDTDGLVTFGPSTHGMANGENVYVDFSPFSNTSISLSTDPTDGLYAITVVNASNFTIIPQPVITGNPITSTSARYVREKKTAMKLFKDGNAAVIMNVGPLIYPAYRSEWQSGYPYKYSPSLTGAKKLPYQLSSHSDQQLEWYTALPDKPASPTGWLGRMMDLVNPSYNANTNLPTLYTLRGLKSGLYSTVPNLVSMKSTGLPSKGVNVNAGNTLKKLDDLIINNQTVPNVLMREYLDAQIRANTNSASIGTMLSLNGTFANTTFVVSAESTNNTYTPVSNIKAIIQIIRSMFNDTTTAAGNVSQRRQVHFLELGGFDQHDDLIPDLDSRLYTVTKTIQKFQEALDETPNIANNTLMLVYSEFGRSLIGNADGSDQAWGGHAMVIGKPVNGNTKSKTANTITYTGKSIYGSPPSINTAGPDFVPFASLLIPTMPVDTVYATIAKWFGIPDGWYFANGVSTVAGTSGAVNPMELITPYLSNFNYNPAANIGAPTWAVSEDSFREIKGLLIG